MSSTVEWYLGGIIHVVITSGMKDKVRQGIMFFLVTVFRGIRYLFAGKPIKPFAILYSMHSLALFLRSDMDLHSVV